MSSKTNSALQSLPLALGLSVVRPTKDKDVLDLIRKLQPLNCGKKLIRIGGASDGGYLVPDDLQGVEYCFSPGVNTSSDFENQLADRGIRSFLADYSVEAPPILRPEFVFDKKFLGACDRDHFFTLATWKDKYIKDYSGDMILQMDIEGFEYQVILNIPDQLLNQFRILVIEFHEVHRLFDPFAFTLLAACFEKLLQYFYVAHIHPNNCSVSAKKGAIEIPKLMEFTFINKRRVSTTSPQTAFPHPLDADNSPNAPMPLPECWYSHP